jgi:voltage-gated potassium channel
MKPKKLTIESPLRQFQLSVLLLVLVVFVGAIGFYIIESPIQKISSSGEPIVDDLNDVRPKDFLDALYWAIETITTIGYGDIHPTTDLGKIWVIGFAITSVISLALIGTNAVAFVVEGHLTKAVRERKHMKELDQIENHFVICGAGRVGMEILRQFRIEKYPYVIIDRDRENLEENLDDHELRIAGDTTSEEVLIESGIKRARCLIACVPNDADNVFTILSAKSMNPKLFVIARGESERSRKILVQAGADRVVMPSHIGGMRMASMAIRPVIVDFLDQTINYSKDREPLLLEEVELRDKCPFIGKMLKDTRIKSETDVLVLGIKNKDRVEFNPSSTYVLQEDDILIGLGTHTQFQRFREYMGTQTVTE